MLSTRRVRGLCGRQEGRGVCAVDKTGEGFVRSTMFVTKAVTRASGTLAVDRFHRFGAHQIRLGARRIQKVKGHVLPKHT